MQYASGNRLLSFLNEVELMICNGRKLVSEPEWTRVRPSLKQKSIIDYIITDAQLLEVSGNVHVCRSYGYRILRSLSSMDGIRSGNKDF